MKIQEENKTHKPTGANLSACAFKYKSNFLAMKATTKQINFQGEILMFRKTLTQVLAAILLLLGSFGLIAPSSAYAQTSAGHAQSAQYSSAKCEKIKDKKKKKACEQKEKKKDTKKNDDKKHNDHGNGNSNDDDGPNHNGHDDDSNHNGSDDSSNHNGNDDD